MKSRSHRLPVDQKDDWVEESWTVDCSCGVNFDDGEEMVDCDDCGVWVHTRCSGYVKTDNSFTCDKCKNNDSSEETEVAQLLVELPTKTVPLPSPTCTTSAFTRPFKLNPPIKERVHVQGIPGDAGDPDLFSGVSAVFGPQLWKCSGYIPKKFNFKYREFPYEEMVDKNSSIETKTDDNGAGALLSLAKLDVEKQPEDGKGSRRFVSPRESGKNEKFNEAGKDSMKPLLLHSEKHTREDPLNTKDRSGKKKARLFEKDGGSSKRIRLRSPVDHAVDAQKSISKENNRQQLPLKLERCSKTTTSALLSNTSGLVPAKEEVGGKSLGSGGTCMQQAEQVHEDSAAAECKADEGAIGSRNVKVKVLSYGMKLSSSGTSFASQEIPSCHSSEIASASDTTITGSVTCDVKAEDDVRRSEIVDMHMQRVDGELPSAALDSDKSNVTASAASSITSPSAILMLMSSASEYCNTGATGHSDSVDSREKMVQESSLNGASTEVVEDEVRPEKAGKSIKQEPSKSALTCVPKSSQLKKISHAAFVSRKAPYDLKDSALDSSSSPTRVAPHASHPTSEAANGQQKMIDTAQHESASNLQKIVTVLQSSSKVAPSNSPSTLSDEELALLLHQELNSSPRVPRVPRMRHAGSLPQLASPTATSVLMKRTCSTGGKDNFLAFSRRRSKDSAKDGGQSFGEMDDESKKMDSMSSPKDPSDVSKKEAESASANGRKMRRFASGSLSEKNEYNYSSSRLSDEEKGGGAPPTHRTLPALLAEIMREGKRMTYEELCNSVLPHWPYLRKHNGERYAYSSHSQAVLDCLRNRHEWARLVDRGPKTSAGRKRRKVDAEETDEHEEFPKGKRKARKRKRVRRDDISDASYSDTTANDLSDGS